MISIKFDTKQVERAFDDLGRSSAIGESRALNRGAVAARTLLQRSTAEDMGLKHGTVRDRLTVTNSTPSTRTAGVKASPSRVPLIEFSARGPEPSRGKGRGVSARLKGGRGRYPHAFIAKRAGRRAVLQRTSSARTPTAELYGPSVAHVAGKHSQQAAERAREVVAKRLEHEIQQAIKQAAKR